MVIHAQMMVARQVGMKLGIDCLTVITIWETVMNMEMPKVAIIIASCGLELRIGANILTSLSEALPRVKFFY